VGSSVTSQGTILYCTLNCRTLNSSFAHTSHHASVCRCGDSSGQQQQQKQQPQQKLQQQQRQQQQQEQEQQKCLQQLQQQQQQQAAQISTLKSTGKQIEKQARDLQQRLETAQVISASLNLK